MSRLALVAAKFADLLDPEFAPVRGQCCELTEVEGEGCEGVGGEGFRIPV
ncbi:hypothetical protein ACIRRT_23400 [Streptomyces sp. NPDC102256]